MYRLAALGLLCAVIAASSAVADVGVDLITTSARPGQIARLRAPARMPLYLVPAARVLQPYRCRKNAICEPRASGPPRRWPYVRLRALSRTASGVIRFHVPPVRSGRYRAVLYCGPCYGGPSGSLIASGNTLVVRS